MKINTLLANKSNYGSKRNVSSIEYIVVHFTANQNDKAASNAKYFANNVVKASAHYFVDETSIYQSVNDDYIAYSVGGAKYSNYSQTGGAKFYGKCTNKNSISVEMCNSLTRNFTVENNTIELIKTLMKKYNIDSSHVIRHFDVTGKICPKYMADHIKVWNNFKSNLEDKRVKISKESPKQDIKNLQAALNKINVGLPKLVVDGCYGNKTKVYLLSVWNLWGWNKDDNSTGWTAGQKTLTKLNLI